jgi:hypothetical protein
MKGSFISYYRPSDVQFADLWERATFVFDANVLLDLYSYAESIRGEMFSVLEKLAPRIWIPYHVGLEYQRNRLNRIKQVNSTLTGAQQKITTAKNSIAAELEQVKLTERQLGLADLDARVATIMAAHDRLLEAVELASKKLPTVSLDDPIRDRLSKLFEGRVGPPPASQDDIAQWVSDAEHRTKNGIPPGFRDDEKDQRLFRDRGLEYEPKLGDLILWKQMLEYIQREKVNRVVFVTRDSKNDWWLLQSPTQTVGPRPELIQEALSRMTDGLFWMYGTPQFLKLAGKYLKTPVSEEAINRAAEVSANYSFSFPTTLDGSFESKALVAVAKWASSRHREARLIGSESPDLQGFPDLTFQTADDSHHGYEIKCIRGVSKDRLEHALSYALEKGRSLLDREELQSFVLVVIPNPAYVRDSEDAKGSIRGRLTYLFRAFRPNAIVYGTLVDDAFVPRFSINPRNA